MRLDVLGEEHADQCAAEEIEDLGAKVGEERGQRAEMQRGIDGETLIRPAEHVRDENEVPGRGDRKELGQALNEPQNYRLRVAHPTISSPPSTPITLPVIQYVSGCESTTMALATSSGVVRRPPGLRRRACAMISSLPGIFCSAGVLVTPARIELAAMPRGPSSAASCLMLDSSAALAADTGP